MALDNNCRSCQFGNGARILQHHPTARNKRQYHNNVNQYCRANDGSDDCGEDHDYGGNNLCRTKNYGRAI